MPVFTCLFLFGKVHIAYSGSYKILETHTFFFLPPSTWRLDWERKHSFIINLKYPTPPTNTETITDLTYQFFSIVGKVINTSSTVATAVMETTFLVTQYHT
jgi:hypothetical protein